MKKRYIVIFLLAVVSVLAGCANENSNNTSNTGNNQDQTRGASSTPGDNNFGQQWNENFSEASSTVLTIGGKVLVMGTENADGSISAERIIVGDSNTDWEKVLPQQKSGSDNQTEQVQPAQGNAENAQIQPSQDQGGQRPDFSQFQNLSEEERQKLRDARAAQGGTGGKGAGSARQGIAQLNGEIISKDDSSFTLKIENGGSKLIFFSSSSKILKPKQAN